MFLLAGEAGQSAEAVEALLLSAAEPPLEL
jgi:hypothetical protein